MKKFVTIAVLLFSIFSFTKAENFTNETKVFSAGLGLGTTLYSGTYYKMRIPPISIMYEQGVYEKTGPGYISAGGYFGIAGSRYRDTYITGGAFGWNYTYISVGVRSSYHFLMEEIIGSTSFEKFDLYAGIQLNLNVIRYNYVGDATYNVSADGNSYVGFGGYAGARYYFKDNISAFGELGYNISYLTIGLSFKLN